MINLVDKSKALTAEDLIRRYNLEGLKNNRKDINSIRNTLNKQYNIIKDFIIYTTPYKNQTDEMTVWFLSGLPSLETSPFKDLTETEKDNSHLYYDKETGKIYQLLKDESNYSWKEIIDSNLNKSLALANAEADTSEGSRKMFFSTPIPPYHIGDVWLDNKTIKRCRCTRTEGDYSELDWVLEEDYSVDFVLADTKAILNQFKESVEETYATHAQLETTQDSIYSLVESETKRVESIGQNNYSELSKKFNNYETVENVTLVKQQVSTLSTSTEYAIKIVEDIQTNGVSQVRTENNYSFTKNGLNIDELGAPVQNLVNNYGVTVSDKTGKDNQMLLFAGYDISSGESLVYSKNILVDQYLGIGKYSRYEDYIDDYDNKGTGCFILEGND